jgi:hypothetical protein
MERSAGRGVFALHAGERDGTPEVLDAQDAHVLLKARGESRSSVCRARRSVRDCLNNKK